jgi:hypothetical protein
MAKFLVFLGLATLVDVCFFVTDSSAKSTCNVINVDAGNAQAFTRWDSTPVRNKARSRLREFRFALGIV